MANLNDWNTVNIIIIIIIDLLRHLGFRYTWSHDVSKGFALTHWFRVFLHFHRVFPGHVIYMHQWSHLFVRFWMNLREGVAQQPSPVQSKTQLMLGCCDCTVIARFVFSALIMGQLLAGWPILLRFRLGHVYEPGLIKLWTIRKHYFRNPHILLYIYLLCPIVFLLPVV